MDNTSIVGLLIIWGVLFLITNLCNPLETMIQGKLTDSLTYKLNFDIMKKSEKIQTLDYFENNQFYDDIQLLSSESSWRPVNLLVFGTSIISNIMLFISMLFIFASFHPIIAIVMVIAIIPQALIFYNIQQQAFETLVSNSEESRKLEYYSQVLLSAESIKDIRLYNLYDVFLKKYTDTFHFIKRNIQSTRTKKFITSVFSLFFTTTLSAGSFIYVILGIKSGVLKIGAIMLFSTSIIYAINSMSRIIEDSSLLYDTLLYMEKLFNFINLNTDYNSPDVTKDYTVEEIEFRNVNFSYPNSEELILKNINFKVKKGERIAIVGENGAGKSTIIKLICMFYGLKEGEILLNNQPLSELSPIKFRKNIAAIFQDFSKFDLTLEENVILSNYNHVDRKEVIEALTKAGIENINDNSLSTVLGKKFKGSRDLSGGEWQKVALARAFYSNSPILILDEPTAAIDARTEYKLFEKFLILTEGKTVFYITHRLSSVRQADKILLLKNGEVVGFDNHNNLMNNNDYYRELYTMQSSLYYN